MRDGTRVVLRQVYQHFDITEQAVAKQAQVYLRHYAGRAVESRVNRPEDARL